MDRKHAQISILRALLAAIPVNAWKHLWRVATKYTQLLKVGCRHREHHYFRGFLALLFSARMLKPTSLTQILRPCHKITGLSLPPNPIVCPEAHSTRIQQAGRAFKSITNMMARAERTHKTGCSISPIFIKHQRIPMKDQYFEYCQVWEISPIEGTKEPSPKTWLCRKGVFCCSQTISFFFLTAFTYTDTENTKLYSFTSNKSRGATGPSVWDLSALVHYSSPATPESCITPSLPPTAAVAPHTFLMANTAW